MLLCLCNQITVLNIPFAVHCFLKEKFSNNGQSMANFTASTRHGGISKSMMNIYVLTKISAILAAKEPQNLRSLTAKSPLYCYILRVYDKTTYRKEY